MKILIMIPCWRRPEIVDLFVSNLERTPCDYAEIVPFFVLSPEDPDYSKMLDITAGYHRVAVCNNPFGNKKNKGLEAAMKLEWDYLMELNSDNIFSPLFWEHIRDYLMTGTDFFGFKDVYVYEPFKDEAVYIEGYHIGHDDQVTAMGWGRCIRREVVEDCVPLWIAEDPFGMDGASDFRIRSLGYKCTVIENGRQPVILGIAHNVCLTAWQQWQECGEEVDADWIVDVFKIARGLCFDLSKFEDFHDAVLRYSNETDTKREAFDDINEAHRERTGEKRYSSYESYQNVVSHKHKNK